MLDFISSLPIVVNILLCINMINLGYLLFNLWNDEPSDDDKNNNNGDLIKL